MNRVHVHVLVGNLKDDIGFYSTLCAAPPTRTETDYAKWMLEDPWIDFAISARGDAAGVDHFGFQVDTADELVALQSQLPAGDGGLVEQTATPCCSAIPDKYWVTDPAGVAWETFHTRGSIPVYGEDREASAATPCCVSKAPSEPPSACCP